MAYVVERKSLTLLERLYIPQILSGMKVTLKHLFAPNVTMEYPEQRPPIPPGYRGVPTLVKDPNGREYFWIGGGESKWWGSDESDFRAIHDGYISVTPLHLDLTNYKLLEEIGRWSLTL